MARYDRISRIPLPPRERAFPCWATLADLEGREREPEVGRRCLLRLLALRPVRRLLDGDGPDDASFSRQVEAVRKEVKRLPSQDPERVALEDYLQRISARDPGETADALLDVAGLVEAAGQRRGAGEFYMTALELTRQHGLAAQQCAALLGVARSLHADAAGTLAMCDQAAALADAHGDLTAWARAELTRAAFHADHPAQARSILEGVIRRGEAENDTRIRAMGTAGICALLLGRSPDGRRAASGSEQDLSGGLEAGLAALHLFPPEDPHRTAILLDLTAAFRGLGSLEAAEACCQAARRAAADAEQRTEAEAGLVAILVAAGDASGARAAVKLLQPTLDGPDPLLAGLLHVALGHTHMESGAVDEARQHLKRALELASGAALDSVLRRAESLLTSLERYTHGEVSQPRPGAVDKALVRRVAERTVRLLETETARV